MKEMFCEANLVMKGKGCFTKGGRVMPVLEAWVT